MKERRYFRHDYGARNDPELDWIVSEYGPEAGWAFWVMIEMLFEQGGRMPRKSYKQVAYAAHVDVGLIQTIVEGSSLFKFDDNFFWSERQNRDEQKINEISQARQRAGKTGGEASGKQRRSKSEANANQNESKTEAINKINKIKINKINKEINKNNSLSLPFTSSKFVDTWNILCVQPKWKGKSANALQLSLNKLAKYDEAFAIYLMEEAIEHNWQGVVFDSTDENYRQWCNQGTQGNLFSIQPKQNNQPKSRIDKLQEDIDIIHNFFNPDNETGITSPDEQ